MGTAVVAVPLKGGDVTLQDKKGKSPATPYQHRVNEQNSAMPKLE
jgi:hypothetical protein